VLSERTKSLYASDEPQDLYGHSRREATKKNDEFDFYKQPPDTLERAALLPLPLSPVLLGTEL
jgi:hypothetical protein